MLWVKSFKLHYEGRKAETDWEGRGRGKSVAGKEGREEERRKGERAIWRVSECQIREGKRREEIEKAKESRHFKGRWLSWQRS